MWSIFLGPKLACADLPQIYIESGLEKRFILPGKLDCEVKQFRIGCVNVKMYTFKFRFPHISDQEHWIFKMLVPTPTISP